MDLLYIAVTVVLFLGLIATLDLLVAGRAAAKDAMREALARGEIGEEQYAASLRALNETV